MNPLFSHLIFQEKTQRCFLIFAVLEETQGVIVNTLALRLCCTLRTIQSDIKQINAYFSASIRVLGDKDGDHFLSQVLRVYIKQKRLSLALDETFQLAFPPQEKAALFLLSLKEEQFLVHNQLRAFLAHFSYKLEPPPPRLGEEQQEPMAFFALLLSLIDQFFQLPPQETPSADIYIPYMPEEQTIIQALKNIEKLAPLNPEPEKKGEQSCPNGSRKKTISHSFSAYLPTQATSANC